MSTVRRICRTCKQSKLLPAFYRVRGKHGTECKQCKRAYSAEMRVLKAAAHAAYYREWMSRPGNRERRKASYDAWRKTPRGQRLRAQSNRIYRAFKRVAATGVAVAMTGCAALPHALRVEAEHVSHPFAGWPCEKQSGSEDELNHVSLIGHWQWGGAYVDAGVGRKTHGRNGSGFYGPSFTGTVRIGYEWRIKE
jgi:hypothetical protein